MVFALNVVDGCIPSGMSTGNGEDIEEEPRLLCVAMTRAKDQWPSSSRIAFTCMASGGPATSTFMLRALASSRRALPATSKIL